MGTVNQGMFTSRTDEWSTPPEFFAAMDEEFGFTLDVCASAENAKCRRYFSREDDGLSRNWHGTAWMNPPYGRGISKWVEKAWRSAGLGATVVCLIPARTDTAYWHDYVMQATEIRFIRGRLHFADGQSPESIAHNAPFPSCVVVFRPFGLLRVSNIDRKGNRL